MAELASFGAIVAGLQARALDVAMRYAPGGHVDGARYWALNPGRHDTRIGSFHVGIAGPYAGKWRDEATGDHGDMLDLIQLALNIDRRAGLAEARAFLGIDAETPAQRALRERQAARAAAQAEADRRAGLEETARRRRAAHALWLHCSPTLDGTPAGAYLAGRGVGVARLGRTPGALRYHPSLAYRHVDADTGEITEGEYPALVAAITGPSVAGAPAEFLGAHRTWLQQDGATWRKADVPAPRKVLGSKKGGAIRLWAGQGPRGGKGAPLGKAAPGQRIFITEGIEDGLSVAVLYPAARVLAAIDLGNLRSLILPPAVAHVTIVRDNDPDPKVSAIADRAAERWMLEGREVSQWRNHHGGKDLNDALQAADAADAAGANPQEDETCDQKPPATTTSAC